MVRTKGRIVDRGSTSVIYPRQGARQETATSLPLSICPAQREPPHKQRSGAPPYHQEQPTSSDSQSSSPAQRETPQKQPHLFLFRSAPRSGRPFRSSRLPLAIQLPRAVGGPPTSSIFSSSIEQPRTAGAPQQTASSLPPSSSPAQRELPQKQPPPILKSQSSSPAQRETLQKQPPSICNPAAPRSGRAPHKQHLLFLYRAAPRSGSSPKSSLLQFSIKQPRAAGNPPETATSLPLSISPAQRETLQKHPSIGNQAAPRSGRPPYKQHRLFLYRAAPRSGSSLKCSLLQISIKPPRAAGDPPETESSLPLSSSPAQRELPQMQPPPIINQAAPRSGRPPRNSLLPPSTEQPRAAGAPPEAASSLPLSSSPAQRETLQKQPPSICNPAAPRSGSPPHKQHLLFLYRAAPRSGSSPKSSLLLPLDMQPRAAESTSRDSRSSPSKQPLIS